MKRNWQIQVRTLGHRKTINILSTRWVEVKHYLSGLTNPNRMRQQSEWHSVASRTYPNYIILTSSEPSIAYSPHPIPHVPPALDSPMNIPASRRLLPASAILVAGVSNKPLSWVHSLTLHSATTFRSTPRLVPTPQPTEPRLLKRDVLRLIFYDCSHSAPSTQFLTTI